MSRLAGINLVLFGIELSLANKQNLGSRKVIKGLAILASINVHFDIQGIKISSILSGWLGLNMFYLLENAMENYNTFCLFQINWIKKNDILTSLN